MDWQIWIEDGERPIPRRYVITTKWMTGAPQFGVVLSDWNVSPQIDDNTFVFEAPAGARKVDVAQTHGTTSQSLGIRTRPAIGTRH